VVEVYLRALDGDLVETAAACAADNERPLVHLAAVPGRTTRDALLGELGEDAIAGALSPYAVHLRGGDPGKLAAVRRGDARVQDEGSQLAALALTHPAVEGRDRRWLDACAGPGGKAALLAGVLGERGGLLVAADRAPHRAGLVRQALAARRDALIVVADGTAPAWADGTFDRVLVDVPCTGLGALRRRPEVRWRRTPDDARRLQPLQVRLLEAAVAATRPGGLVAYVTCSPDRIETEEVIAAVRGPNPGLLPVPTAEALPALPAHPGSTGTQLWPHRHGTDGMYVSVLRRPSPHQ
jgi:16S rRNA (cytosine967-C5)-methyltransferase